MAVMDSFLITVDGSKHEVSTGTVRRLLDTSARFWLDLADVDKSTADGLLRDTFGFHPVRREALSIRAEVRDHRRCPCRSRAA